jgi:hypothetical protein
MFTVYDPGSLMSYLSRIVNQKYFQYLRYLANVSFKGGTGSRGSLPASLPPLDVADVVVACVPNSIAATRKLFPSDTFPDNSIFRESNNVETGRIFWKHRPGE